MAVCGDHEYDMIEYANLFDLRDVQLLRAEIDAISRANNTADITFLDACPDYAVSMLAVPFFYHCQYSTGTVEDLAHGHNAFSVGDMVYVIHAPANGDVAERMYIVGHVDIRGTRVCPTEFLFVTLTFTLNSTSYSYTTIFDASTGTKLDLASFTNRDESSPDKPSSLPTATSGMSAWQVYNFGSVPIDGYIVTGGVAQEEGYTNAPFDYTGNIGICSDSASSSPYTGSRNGTECADFDTGNGGASASYSATCESDDIFNSPIKVYEEYADESSGDTVNKVTTGGTTCGPVCATVSSATSIYRHGVDGYIVINGAGADSVTVPLVQSYEYNSETSGSCSIANQAITSASYSASESFAKAVYYDFSGLSVPNIAMASSWATTLAGSLPQSPTYDGDAHVLSITSVESSHSAESPMYDDIIYGGINDDINHYFQPWSNITVQSSTFLKGRYYMYTILGAVSLEQWNVTTVGGECSAHYSTTGIPYPGRISGGQASGTPKYVLKYIPGTSVVWKENILPVAPAYAISALDTIRHRDSWLSSGLNDVVIDLLEHVVSQVIDYSNLSTANEDVKELLAGIQSGPTCTVLLKRS